jgi:hypothetical protein
MSDKKPKIVKMNISELVLDFDLYPRNDVSSAQVTSLVDAIESGFDLPPIIADAKSKRVVDGFHRHKAYTRCKIEEVRVELREYENDGTLFADAVRLNRGHGRTLDPYDIKRAIDKLTTLGFAKEAIAGIVRMPLPRMDEIVKGFAHNAAGDAVPLKGGTHHLAGTEVTAGQEKGIGRVSGMNATFHAKQLILMLEQGLYKSTPAFEEAMDRLTELWDQKHAKA